MISAQRLTLVGRYNRSGSAMGGECANAHSNLRLLSNGQRKLRQRGNLNLTERAKGKCRANKEKGLLIK